MLTWKMPPLLFEFDMSSQLRRYLNGHLEEAGFGLFDPPLAKVLRPASGLNAFGSPSLCSPGGSQLLGFVVRDSFGALIFYQFMLCRQWHIT
jgi:hypothetical protein